MKLAVISAGLLWKRAGGSALLVLLGLWHGAWADELMLSDGSRLLGEAVSKSDGTLKFKTSFAGTIDVSWDQVAELRTDEPTTVLLRDKEVVLAREIRRTDQGATVVTEPGAPPRELAKAEIAFIKPEPWRLGERIKFTGTVNVGLTRESGNTDKDEIDMDGKATLRRLNDRLQLFGEWQKENNGGSRTKNKWKLSGNYNYFYAPQWFYGGVLRFERDQFADLRLRTSVGPLIGHQFFETDELNLSFSGGPLYVNENFHAAEDDDYWAASWEIHYDQYLFSRLFQLYHDQTGSWSMSDTSNLVWNTWSGIRVPVYRGVAITAEVQSEYNGTAPSGTDELDMTYWTKLGYGW